MSFDNLGLRAEFLSNISSQGYTKPTLIQEKAIPAILAGNDILAGSQTGTGKTAAFAIPILQKLSVHKEKKARARPVRCLVITPTRELAAQVGESFKTYGRGAGLKSSVVFGGVGYHQQIQSMRRGIDILTATPGRLLDHLDQGNLELSTTEILVLDEADRMLDMGFIHDIRRLIKALPAKRQNLLFSATYSQEIRKLAAGLLEDPVHIDAAPRNAAAEKVDQRVYPVAGGNKRELLSRLIREGEWNQVLVFTRTKHGANRLTKQLETDGIRTAAIHGNKSQTARTRALAAFKAGSLRVLAATDIAARGLDIKDLPHVVNYDLPHVAEDYVHRIGRTGRAGKKGQAVSLVSKEEARLLRGIQRLLGRELPKESLPGIGAEVLDAPPRRESSGGGGGGGGRRFSSNQQNKTGRRRNRNGSRSRQRSAPRETA